MQEIFRITPHEKQVMMFSATLSKDIRPVCRKFMQDVSDRSVVSPQNSLEHCFISRETVYALKLLHILLSHAVILTRNSTTDSLLFPLQPMEVFVDDETKLTLHGLQQYYSKLKDSEKNRKLFDLLDVLEFNQVKKMCLLNNFWIAC